MFSSQLNWKSLALTCRSLGTMLDSGVAIDRAFKTAGQKASSAKIGRAMLDIAEEIDKGSDVTTAMLEQDLFPPLFIEMVSVGEQTGTLPEVLKSLAEHYENFVRLKKEFLQSITWPLIQLAIAILVIAGMIWLLGMIAEMTSSDPVDPLGLGLTGTWGALTWLGMNASVGFGLYFVYSLMQASLSTQKFFHSVLLAIPVMGHAMRSFATSRFAWSFYLTQNAGLAIDKSLEASFRATSNGAFISAMPYAIGEIMSGQTLEESLRSTNLFPIEFLEMVHVGETSGTVPELLHRMSPELEAEARRSLDAMSQVLSWVIWLIVAVFILFFVISIFLWYLSLINDALQAL